MRIRSLPKNENRVVRVQIEMGEGKRRGVHSLEHDRDNLWWSISGSHEAKIKGQKRFEYKSKQSGQGVPRSVLGGERCGKGLNGMFTGVFEVLPTFIELRGGDGALDKVADQNQADWLFSTWSCHCMV